MRSERVSSSDDGRSVDPAEASRDDVLPRLLTLSEVAARLSVSPKTVRRLLSRGFPCVRVGRSVRFEPQAVVRWLTARREGAQGA
jgi:excisionase family DNA binding protein